jgi:excisionase family DNA binding protein
MDQQLLRVPDAARRLALSRATIYSLMARGLLRFVRVPGVRSIRVPASEIQRLVEAGARGGWALDDHTNESNDGDR